MVSTVRTLPMVADKLRRQADRFIELQDLAPEITRAVQHAETRTPTPAQPELGIADAR